VTRDFSYWLRPDGPIRRYFNEQSRGIFSAAAFRAANEDMAFVHGMLSVSAIAELQQELRTCSRKRFAELHQDSVSLPVGSQIRDRFNDGDAGMGADGVQQDTACEVLGDRRGDV